MFINIFIHTYVCVQTQIYRFTLFIHIFIWQDRIFEGLQRVQENSELKDDIQKEKAKLGRKEEY
jgi:hypothetical protein